MELVEPWALPADPTLAGIASEFDAVGACTIFLDAEWFYVYGSIAAKAMLARWDLRNYGMSQRGVERMSMVARPDRRPTAILFADLEGSTPLSKRVSTAQHFAFGYPIVPDTSAALLESGHPCR